jgi:hypothetical protein
MADRFDDNDPVGKRILDRMNAFQNDGSGYLPIRYRIQRGIYRVIILMWLTLP